MELAKRLDVTEYIGLYIVKNLQHPSLQIFATTMIQEYHFWQGMECIGFVYIRSKLLTSSSTFSIILEFDRKHFSINLYSHTGCWPLCEKPSFWEIGTAHPGYLFISGPVNFFNYLRMFFWIRVPTYRKVGLKRDVSLLKRKREYVVKKIAFIFRIEPKLEKVLKVYRSVDDFLIGLTVYSSLYLENRRCVLKCFHGYLRIYRSQRNLRDGGILRIFWWDSKKNPSHQDSGICKWEYAGLIWREDGISNPLGCQLEYTG